MEHLASEIIVIEDSDSEAKVPSSHSPKPIKTKKDRVHKHRRRVRLSKGKKDETLIVTQEVNIKKQKVECVESSVILTKTCNCKHKRKERKDRSITSQCTDRIVPSCMRRNCVSVHRKRKSLDYKENKTKNSKTKTENVSLLKNLSPISSPNIDSFMPYEAISSDSFSIFSDDGLDTLIKRTKERLSSSGASQELPYASSTPYHLENVSDMDTKTLSANETNISVHSIATVVLDTQLDIYSPADPNNSPILCYL